MQIFIEYEKCYSYYLLILIHICSLFKRYKNMHYVLKKFIDNIERTALEISFFFFNILYIVCYMLYSKNCDGIIILFRLFINCSFYFVSF